LQTFVSLFLNCFGEEKVCYFFVELRYKLFREEGGPGTEEGDCDCADKVLVLLIKHLVEYLWRSSCWVHNLSHHDNQLTDNCASVKLIMDLTKVFFEVLIGSGVLNEHGETIIVTVQKDGFVDLKPD
jgi:hypothetical protein